MKLKKMISPTDGFFSQLESLYPDDYTSYFGNYKSSYLDVKFFSEYGERSISPVLLYYSVNDSITEDNFISVCEILYEAYIENWKRLYETFHLDYDIIYPYNTSEETVTASNTKTTNEDVTTSDNDVYGFNSDSPVNDTDKTDSSTGNSEKDGNETVTYVKKGNIGNTAFQDFIVKEIELRKQKFIDCVFTDVAKFATLPIYE